MNPLFANLPTTIFTRMSALAVEHEAVNLGQGFPDFGWPDDVVARAAEALIAGSNQYAPMPGLPELRGAVADHYRAHQGIEVDPGAVVVTSGATEALAASLMALDRAGRRGPALPAALRRLSAAGASRRRGAALRPAGAARLADHRRGARGGVHAGDEAGRVQQPAQPLVAGVRRGRAGPARRGLRQARCDRAHRRGLGACRLRRPPPPAAGRAFREWPSGR